MAKAKKKSPKLAQIPPHPSVPRPEDIGALCADVYRHTMKIARQQGVDEQTVEQVAMGEVRNFMAACIRQSKSDWKAYGKATGVHAVYVPVKASARKKAKKKSGSKAR